MNQAEIKRKQAQAISDILALVTIAIVARLVGYNGVAYIAAAVETVAAVWMIVGGNLTNALGRLIRSRNSKGQQRNAARIRKNAFLFQAVVGLAGSLGLLAGADQIARSIFRVQYATFILMVMSPVIFLKSISAVFLGYFQGEGSEFPAVASGILRQVFILGFSLLFGRMLGKYGVKVSRLLAQENFTSMYSGVGVAIAVSVTELFVVIFLFLIYWFSKRYGEGLAVGGTRSAESFIDSIRILFGTRGLQWVTGLLTCLPVPLGFIFLSKSGEADTVAMPYGVYISAYLVLCGIWTAIIMLSVYPVCGRTLTSLRKEGQRLARTVFRSGIHICVVHALFASSFLMVLSSQFAQTFFADQAEIAAEMLKNGGLAVLFLVLSLYFGRILNLAGWNMLVLGAVGSADVVYIISVAVMLRSGSIGVQALVYGGVLGLGVACVLLGTLACRQLKYFPDWLRLIVVPGGAACVSGLLCMLLGRVLTPHLGGAVTLIVLFVVCCSLYWALLILLRNFSEQELDVIPGGRLIRSLGQLLHVF